MHADPASFFALKFPAAGSGIKFLERIPRVRAAFGRYFGKAVRRRRTSITAPEALQAFLQTRASFVAQMSLYGYLRTRAGTRYPELFDSDVFVESINIAKWQVWLACLSDLSIFAGALLARRSAEPRDAVTGLMDFVVGEVLAETGIPDDAGSAFSNSVTALKMRIQACDWSTVGDGEEAFGLSPAALVEWAPIVEDIKQLDEHIVRNSVRFRWQEVRRDLRRDLDADAVLSAHRQPR